MARYTDSLLMDGEHVVYRTRQHPLGRIAAARWGILMVGITIAALLAIVIFNPGGTARDLLGWITLGLLVLGAANIVWVYLHWWAEDYAITNRRILKVEGLFNKRAADSGLEKINDAILEQSLLGRMFDWGHLRVLTAAEEVADDYHMLHHAPKFKKTMLLAKQDIEDELARRITAPRQLVLDVLLREQHRLLELRCVMEHVVVVRDLLGRGEDPEVAPVEHPPEEALLEDRVVDLLEAAVGGTLVEEPLHLQDAPVRDGVVLGPPVQVDPDDVRGAEHEQAERDPAEEITRGPAGVEDDDREQRGNGDPHHEDPPPRGGDPAERMLPRPVYDVLPVHEQRVGVARHPVLPPWSRPSGARMRPSVHLPDPLAGQVRVDLRRADARMSQQLLDDPQVGPALQQVRGERVAERVRRRPPGKARGRGGPLHDIPRLLARQPAAAVPQEDRATTVGGHDLEREQGGADSRLSLIHISEP